MCLHLMCLQIHLRLKHDKLFIEAFLVHANKVRFPEVLLERIVVEVILRLASLVSPVANVTSLVLFSAVSVELVVSVKVLPTEPAFGMSSESALVSRAWPIVSLVFVSPQLLLREQLVLMRKDLLVSRAEIAHNLVVCRLYVSVEIWPSEACHITAWIRAVVS
jgi:hypothetical protein